MNQAPTLSGATRQARAGGVTLIQLVAADADGDPLTFRVVGTPVGGTVTFDDVFARFDIDVAKRGVASFEMVANDGQADSAVARVDVTVFPPFWHALEAQAGARFVVVDGAPTATGVPVLLRAAPDTLPARLLSTDRAALRVLEIDGETLPIDIESFGPGVEVRIWVLLPLVEPGAELFLYGAITGNPFDAQPPSTSTWTSYDAVYHNADAPMRDATINAFDGIDVGTTAVAAGVVGAARAFGGGQVIVLPDALGGLLRSTRGSVSFFARIDDVSDNLQIAFYAANAPGGEGFGPDREIHLALSPVASPPFDLYIEQGDGGADRLEAVGATPVTAGVDIHVAGSWATGATTTTARLAQEGSEVGRDVGVPVDYACGASILLGGPDNPVGGTRDLVGRLDEVRISDQPRSDAQLRVEALAARDQLLELVEPFTLP